MRVCAKQAGCVSISQAELYTQNTYFVFLVLQVFLVQTLANSFVSSIVTIVQDPSQVFTMLSSSIPTASNFYISYFIVQGLGIATSVLTQVVGCVIFNLLYKFLASTPRAMYNKWTTLSALTWGSLMPVYTNIAVISELILGFYISSLANLFRHCLRCYRPSHAFLVDSRYGSVLPCLPLQHSLCHRDED